MKKFAAVLIAGVVLAAAPAFADTMENAYSNTIVVTAAGTEGETLYHFNADGTFTGVAAGGSQMAGSFTLEGDQLCLIQPNGQPACTSVAAGKNVGDTWTQLGVDGREINVELRAGR
ncbi:MAG: hypothetical protein AB7T59_08625 [Hyphomonadaceae bacterium]